MPLELEICLTTILSLGSFFQTEMPASQISLQCFFLLSELLIQVGVKAVVLALLPF